ncbi:MatE family protein [Tritrichomonas foetus]|uniref:MatE family protein n=1 Tax=Tritrichomonas foetus TaxID=1144522 RepID=A0A1J4K8E1_9EUKA|nr:MatE family protein [Tritrichomonas foetus]|eukprot:OHT05693.1 MatE family protein [Tritrichomonas foetus]
MPRVDNSSSHGSVEENYLEDIRDKNESQDNANTLKVFESEESEEHKGGLNEEEIYRLAGRPPLITILHLMIGPVISQVTGALYGIVNSIWISHGIGEVGLSAVATEVTLEGIGRSFGYFLMVSASTKISQLFGQGRHKEATQVVADLLRCTLICGAIVPLAILPAHNELCKWFGASELTTKLGYEYIMPLCACSVLTCINLACQGFLQAEGRTMLIGLIDLTSVAVACGGLCPLFMYGFKTGINAASISIVFADGVPGIVLMILYFKGKFGIKPKWNQLLKPFSKETFPALLIGLSQLISNLASNIPGIPIRNLIGLSSGDSYHYDLAMSGFNVICRYTQFAAAVIIAITTGYLAPASYAHAAGDDARYLSLSFHAGWLAFVWSILTTIFSVSIPRQISMIFGNGEEYLAYAGPMLRNGTCIDFLRWVQFNAQAMLQALQFGGRAMVVSFLSNFAAFLGFAYLYYYTDKHNVIRLMWLYPSVVAFGFVTGSALLVKPLWNLYEQSKKSEEEKKEADSASSEDSTPSEIQGLPEL